VHGFPAEFVVRNGSLNLEVMTSLSEVLNWWLQLFFGHISTPLYLVNLKQLSFTCLLSHLCVHNKEGHPRICAARCYHL